MVKAVVNYPIWKFWMYLPSCNAFLHCLEQGVC